MNVLSKHSLDTGDKFSFKDVDILKQENKNQKRSIKEMIQIKKCDSINIRSGVDKLGWIDNQSFK